MAAPSFKNRGGGPAVGGGGRGGRNSGAGGGHASLGSNSRWLSGPPRQSNSNTANNPANASAGTAGAEQSLTSRGANAGAGSAATQVSGNAFPPLGRAGTENSQVKMHDRVRFLLNSLVGTMVLVTVRGGTKYVGLLSATSTERGELGISLSSVQQIQPSDNATATPELGPAKGSITIPGHDLDDIEAFDIKLGDPSKAVARPKAENDTFRTDSDISKLRFDALGSGRVLQKWSDDPGWDVPEAAAASYNLNGSSNGRNLALGGLEDSSANRPSGGGGAWDQFAVNERQFGVRSNYDEDIYTTKLDRSGKDFKERERNAERIAREIMNSSTNNPHLAEERNQVVPQSGTVDEEAKYGAVQRGPNAYIPPAARRAGGGGSLLPASKVTPPSTSPTAAAASKALPPKAAAAGPATNTAAPSSAAASNAIKPPTVTLHSGSNDGTPELASTKIATGDVQREFSKFVSSERERMLAKRKEQMQNELHALKAWHGNFQLKTPMPDQVDNPLRNKNKANVSEKPRDPSLQKSLSPNATHADATRGIALSPPVPSTAESNSPRLPPFNRNVGSASSSSGLHTSSSRPAAPKMTIAKIPPFDPEKFKARQAALKGQGADAGTSTNSTAPASGAASSTAKANASSAAKLSAKASAFKPFNPNATAFTPGAPTKKPEGLPATASTVPATSTNPFFGNRVLKKPASHAPLHVREEFNPFKVSKVPEAVSISPEWRFTGKNYRQLFTAVQPPAPATAPSVASTDDGYAAGPNTPQSVPQPQPGMMPTMIPGGVHPGHGVPLGMQGHHPGPQGPPPHSAGPPQQLGLPYPGQAQLYHRFPQQPQHFPQQMHMPGGQGMPHYGAMQPQFVGAMPFSPPIPGHGGHPVYSPQMANMPPPGQHGQFIPQPGPMPGPMAGGLPHGPGQGPPRGGPGGAPPHMQKGPPQVYFQQPGPVHGMPYGHGPHFMPGGPGGRPGMPPMDGSFPGGGGVGGPPMSDPGNNHM